MPDAGHPRSTPPQLMEQYRRAYRMLAEQQGANDAMELLSGCVANDPGNLIFVETFLAALKHRVRPPGLFRGVMQRYGCLRAIEREEWDKVLKLGPGVILLRPTDAPVLRGLAQACQQRGFKDVALRYWTATTELLPNDVDTQRAGGITFGEQGHFGQAMNCWERVLRRHPDDVQAKALLRIYHRLRPVSQDLPTPAAAPTEVAAYFERATECVDAGQPQQARQWIEQGLNISPGDQRLRDRLQELNVQVAEQRYRVAQEQAGCLQTPDANELASRLEEDWRREELDVAFDRYHRWPGRADLRLNLALLLKQLGRFEEAVALLCRPPEEMAGAWREQLELGECLQYLRRFDEAYSQYRSAALAAGDSTDQLAKLARFRAGSLALALGRAEAAATLLEVLVAIDRSFPDAVEKLNEARLVIAQSQAPKSAAGE